MLEALAMGVAFRGGFNGGFGRFSTEKHFVKINDTKSKRY